jgi:Tfp pilus assembly protein PilF
MSRSNGGKAWPRGNCVAPRQYRIPSWRRYGTGLLATAALALTASACGGGAPPTPKPSKAAVTATLNQAIRQLNRGKAGAAAAGFLAVVKDDPSNQIAWYDLGYIAEEHQQNKSAVHDYEASIGANATYVPALYNLAILDTPKLPQTAAKLYREAIAVDPGDADAHLNLGFLLISLHQVTGGQEELARAVQLNPALSSRIPISDTKSG